MRDRRTASAASRYEKALGWVLVFGILLFVTILQTFLASRYSLWGDEFVAIAPALAPWRGTKNFWWQIYQYIANPPGENLVLRLLYRSQSLQWLRESSQEVFWRLPYILVYGLTGFFTYLLSLRWSRSPLIAFATLACFLALQGPFAYGTETRFYAWAIFFMTLIAWQTLFLLERSFSFPGFATLALITAVGVCFHVSVALNCYALFWFSVAFALFGLKQVRTNRWDTWKLVRLLAITIAGLLPFFVFKYEKHHWIFLPQGSGPLKVLLPSLIEAPRQIPEALSHLLPISWFWSGWGWKLFMFGLSARLVFDVYRRRWRSAACCAFLGCLSVGGCLMLLISSNANHWVPGDRYYLFSLPVFLSAAVYLVAGPLRSIVPRIPVALRCLVMIGLAVLSAGQIVSLAHAGLGGSMAKINIDLARFRSFYTDLPDKRKLVLVGVGDKDLWAQRDDGSFIGGVHLEYTREFSPLFLNSRETSKWKLPSTMRGWSRYDFLVFVPLPGKPGSPVAKLPWKQMKCTAFPLGGMKFCRTAMPADPSPIFN